MPTGTRRIWVSPCTANPRGLGVTRQARNFERHLQDERLPWAILRRDQDPKHAEALDGGFRSTRFKIKKTCSRSPNLPAFVGREIQTLNHQGLDNQRIVPLERPPDKDSPIEASELRIGDPSSITEGNRSARKLLS